MTTTKLPAAFSPEVMAEMLSADARAEMARPWSPVDPNVAELGPLARWYVLEVRNRDVEADLIKRRFGIYVPEFEETIISRGRKVERRGPLIPGYVFVFLWDVGVQHPHDEADANWMRAVTTPGVTAILGWLPDEEIDRLRAIENGERLDSRARARLQERILRKVRPSVRRKGRRLKRRGKAAALA
jgi:transcriptional antiterminator NusG